ncbi:MAG TPA: MATE family efflux transporter, partial [Bacteriovoracaceae bacterium]|nr:MATE family efflux transporter [Bacteriovoracaceae bacterium]
GTQGLTAIYGVYLMVKGKHGLKLHTKNLLPQGTEVNRIIKLGLPASMEQSTRALSMLMITFLVTSFGVVGTAAYGVGARVLSFVIIPALGFSLATSTVVGQNIGARKYERAQQTAKAACFIIFISLTTVGLFTFIFAHQLISIFVPDSPLVQEEGANFIRTISLTFGLIGFQQVVSGALRGGGSTLISMLLAMATLWVFRFPTAYVLSKHTELGIKGVWWAFGISNLIAGVLSWYLLFKTKWMKNLTHTDQDDLSDEQIQTLEETKISDNLST